MRTQPSMPSATDALSEVHEDTTEQRNNNKQSRTEKTTLKNNKMTQSKHKTDKSTTNIKLNTLKDHKITPNVQRTTQEVLKRHTTLYLCNNTQNDDPEM